MSTVPNQLPELAEAVSRARAAYEAIRSEGTEARRRETDALNRLNDAQKKLSAAFSDFAKAQPTDSDLHREWSKKADRP